eukprot:UN25121
MGIYFDYLVTGFTEGSRLYYTVNRNLLNAMEVVLASGDRRSLSENERDIEVQEHCQGFMDLDAAVAQNPQTNEPYNVASGSIISQCNALTIHEKLYLQIAIDNVERGQRTHPTLNTSIFIPEGYVSTSPPEVVGGWNLPSDWYYHVAQVKIDQEDVESEAKQSITDLRNSYHQSINVIPYHHCYYYF